MATLGEKLRSNQNDLIKKEALKTVNLLEWITKEIENGKVPEPIEFAIFPFLRKPDNLEILQTWAKVNGLRPVIRTEISITLEPITT